MTINRASYPEPCRPWRKSFVIAAAVATMLLAATLYGKSRPQSSALWRVVHDLCVVDKRTIGLAAPCVSVDLRKGTAIIKDAGGPTGYLLVPTTRSAGIEDPALLASDAPNYWQLAWEARRFVERRASRRLNRTDLAIAVNSATGRTQNQLHLHVDCVRPEVRDALRSAAPGRDGSWTGLNLHGHPYWLTAVQGAEITLNLFRMLADSDQAIATNMDRQTLVVVGAELDGAPGFYILRGSVSPNDAGHGEELLDHRCRLLTL